MLDLEPGNAQRLPTYINSCFWNLTWFNCEHSKPSALFAFPRCGCRTGPEPHRTGDSSAEWLIRSGYRWLWTCPGLRPMTIATCPGASTRFDQPATNLMFEEVCTSAACESPDWGSNGELVSLLPSSSAPTISPTAAPYITPSSLPFHTHPHFYSSDDGLRQPLVFSGQSPLWSWIPWQSDLKSLQFSDLGFAHYDPNHNEYVIMEVCCRRVFPNEPPANLTARPFMAPPLPPTHRRRYSISTPFSLRPSILATSQNSTKYNPTRSHPPDHSPPSPSLPLPSGKC